MPINPITGLEENEPAAMPTPLPAELANLKPPPVVYPDAPVATMPVVEPEPAAMPMPEATRMVPVETSETMTTTKQTSMTPGEKRLMAERDAVVAQQIQTAQKSAEIAKAQANIEMQKQAEIAAMASKREEAIGKLMEQADKELAVKTSERQAEYEKFKAMDFKDYWDTPGAGSRIVAAIAVGLGQFGMGMQGKAGNPALDIINKQIDMDFAKQKAAIDKQQAQYQMAKEGEASTSSSYAKQLQNLQLKEAAAYESVAAKYASMLAAQGVPAAQIQSDANVQALQGQALDKKLQVEKELRNEVTTQVRKKVDMQTVDAQGNIVTPEKPPTEGQGKARGLVGRMAQGVKEYDAAGGLSPADADKMRKHISDNYSLQKDAGGLLRYVLKPSARPLPENFSEQARLAWNAVTELADASLRLESGAVVGDDEIKNRREALLPTAGDTAKVIAQKRGRMTQLIASGMQQTGKNNMGAPPPEPKNSGLERMERDGVMFVKTPGGWRKEK
jgi:hypothetical protein